MVANYICENCLKSFKTNQHLSQHKNRKKKCITYKEKDLTQMSAQNYGQMPQTLHANEMLMLKNTNINGSDCSFTNLIELILAYKTLLDTNKALETKMNDMENKTNNLIVENKFLRRKIKLVQEFVTMFNECDYSYPNDLVYEENLINEENTVITDKTMGSQKSEKSEKKCSFFTSKYDKISPLTDDD
jgi:hypothetical protein